MASYSRNYGYKVDVYSLDEIPYSEKYDIIGLSVFEGTNEEVFRDVLFLKRLFPKNSIVVGGRWTKIIDKETESWFTEQKVELWHLEGEKYFNGGEEIDFSVYPGWYKKDLLTLNTRGRNLMSSRGCPFHCYFCHNPENKIHYLNAKYTVDNIQLILEQGSNEVFFADDIFTLNEEHMLKVYEELKKRCIDISGRNLFFTHINLINENNSKVMKKYNPYEVQIGVESGDDRMLKTMGKGFTSEKAFEKIKLLSEHVPVNALFLIGYPGETLESLNNTYEFVKRIKPFIKNKWVSLYQPIQNTKGYFESLKEGTFEGKLKNNSNISYIPAGLTAGDLTGFREKIMQL